MADYKINSNIIKLQSNMNALKKSVADGKKSVASAISAKGISTATDATFAVMAANIGKIVTKKVIQIGSVTNGNHSQNFDIKPYYASYNTLNNNNFLLANSRTYICYPGSPVAVGSDGIIAPSLSYNAVTGILTFNSNYSGHKEISGWWINGTVYLIT